jgi:hypothetical protein
MICKESARSLRFSLVSSEVARPCHVVPQWDLFLRAHLQFVWSESWNSTKYTGLGWIPKARIRFFHKVHGLLLSSVFSYSPDQSVEPSPISKLLAEIVISVRQSVGPLLFSPRILQILMYRGSGSGHDLNNRFYFLIGSFILCVHRVESRRRPLWNATRAARAADCSCGMTVMKAGSETGAELWVRAHNLHPSFLRSSRAHPGKRHFLLLNFSPPITNAFQNASLD